jgi:hypothetical protein
MADTYKESIELRNRRARANMRLDRLSFEDLAQRGFRITHNYRDGAIRMAKATSNVPSGELFVFVWGAWAVSPILSFEEVMRTLDRKQGLKAVIGDPVPAGNLRSDD